MLQDPSGVVDHIVNDLLCREDLVYLSRDATGDPWSGTDEIFGVLLEVIFDWDDGFSRRVLASAWRLFSLIERR